MPSRTASWRFLRTLKTAAKPVASPEASLLPKEGPKLTTLPNGIVVASLENYTPISKVSVSFKAGSRYEGPANLGVTHALRNAAGLGTKNYSILGITRNIQQIGGFLTASSTREHFGYNVEANRDNLDVALGLLLDVSMKQAFKPWEVDDASPRLKINLAALKDEPYTLVLENLHKVAYREGLGNSLYMPLFMFGEHEPEMLHDYVTKHFTTNRTAVSGIGVSHEALVAYANSLPMDSGAGPAARPAKYGGGEIRVDTGSQLSYVAVATEGVSLKNPKDMLALAILQHVLGTVPHIKWSNGLAANKLAQAASKATDKPFAISGLNINYSDSGLFGFSVVADHADMGKILKSVFGHYSSLTKSGVTEEEVQKAKNKLKASVLLALETDSQIFEELTVQSLVNGQLISQTEVVKTIDGLSAADVTTLAKKVINGKPSMSAVGNLSDTPYLDQLL